MKYPPKGELPQTICYGCDRSLPDHKFSATPDVFFLMCHDCYNVIAEEEGYDYRITPEEEEGYDYRITPEEEGDYLDSADFDAEWREEQ